MDNNTGSDGSFNNLGIAPKLLDILQKNKFTKPTPIQAQSIPSAIEGKDLMGIAQTGTGKTLAFGIPMIQRLAQSQGKVKGLVILPTRELALQVDETLRKIGSSLGLKTAILIGGESMFRQLKALRQNPHIIIGTPGRLNDHIEHEKLNLSQVGILVLDEADRMLDMGFAPQIKKILDRVPKVRQTMLFSATMPEEIVRIAQSYLNLPLRIEVAPAGSAVKTVSHELFFVDRAKKLSLLKSLLAQYKGSVLVFTRTKHGARKITQSVRGFGYTSAEIHSNRSLNQRIEALAGFKIGRYRVLVATDIAARGIDVTGIELVINFDLPATPEDYVHRIGRTGRAGTKGHAISFATPDQRSDVRQIERLIKIVLPVSQTPALTTDNSERFHDEADRNDRYERPQGRFAQRSEPRSTHAYQPGNSFGNRRPQNRKPWPHRNAGKPMSREERDREENRSRGRGSQIRKPSRPVHAGTGYFLKRHEPKN